MLILPSDGIVAAVTLDLGGRKFGAPFVPFDVGPRYFGAFVDKEAVRNERYWPTLGT